MRYLLVCFTIALVTPVSGQCQHRFSFPDLDAKMISVWSACLNGDTSGLEKNLAKASTSWDLVRAGIKQLDIVHFSSSDFIAEVDAMMHDINIALEANDINCLEQMSYEFMAAFREVRMDFTGDQYPLDELFLALERYEEVHYAVDDPLLGLYEWNQFIRLFTDFKEQFDRYCRSGEAGFKNGDHVLYSLMVQRVRDCSAKFESALNTAMQNEFVAPCDDTHQALIDLIKLYTTPRLTL
ncbi:MAG: hypothetical protein HKN87_19075 [Saprospiraceae bacterium]|nr:hypothetical protein [Saprospiraceae bacterium]